MRLRTKVIAAALLLMTLGGAVLTRTPAGAVDWRLKLFDRKLQGNLSDLGWRELFSMMAGRDRYNLGAAIEQGRSLEGAIENPHVTEQDRAAGAQLFTRNCSPCHGADATGGHAPSLV